MPCPATQLLTVHIDLEVRPAGMIRIIAFGAVFSLLSGFCQPAWCQSDEDYRIARLDMVNTVIESEGIKNEAVLNAMRLVPRHLFVPAQLRSAAYYDQALAIGYRQTISPPFIVAYMTQVIDPQPTDRVLEIGTGSGYQAAILSGIVKNVYTIEIVEELGKQAAERLGELGYRNVYPRIGDGYKGWAEEAPFDKIIVTCSPEDVPQPLVDQLKEGGRMIIPLGERYQQVFYLFEKRDGKLVKTELLPTLFVPMTGISEEKREILPDPRNPQLVNGSFEQIVGKDGHATGWHYQRQMTLTKGQSPAGTHYAHFANTNAGRSAHALQGVAVDGRRIGALEAQLWVRGVQIRPGDEKWERAAFIVHFFDQNRHRIGEHHLGPWSGSFTWKNVTGELKIPPQTREVIIQVGLNGAYGAMSIDNIQIKAIPR